MDELLRTLAAKAHDHQLVPFVGAGCSLGHVQFDWDGIAQLMAGRLTHRSTASNPDISEAFVQEHGEQALADLLKEKLLIREFCDEHGTTPLQILALELRALYTTNLDNVLECAAEKYGRPFVVVSTLNNLRDVRPRDRLLYKFHGSLDHPETLIFTTSQYQARMVDAANFLDIRLRSDLLTKSLLFIGYSFRDPNIKFLFRELKDKFSNALPGSFLIAYQWSDDLERLCADHGVECVAPEKHIEKPSDDPKKNLEEFLCKLCQQTFALSTSTELDDLFRPMKPAPVRIAIRSQIEAVAALASSGNEGALPAFRGTCDGVVVPESLESLVSESFVEIVRRSPLEQHGNLSGALFNLHLRVPYMLQPVAAYLAFANRLPPADLPIYPSLAKSWPHELLPLAAASAVELLLQWNEPITDGFYCRASQWFDRHWMGLPDSMKIYARPLIAKAWAQRHTIYEQPIARAERIAKLYKHQSSLTKSYSEIHRDLIALFPKRFPTPPE